MKQLELKLNNFCVVPRIVLRGSAIIFVCCLLFPPLVEAATLYLEPATGQFQPGETFIVDIRIDTEGECINAVEANLSFSSDILKATDFSRGESILSLWVKEPTFSVVSCGEADVSCGLVSFSGGIPGGYCGRIPGDPGTSNLLGKIIFRAPGMTIRETTQNGTQNYAKISFLESSKVLLNDGLGTPAKLTTKGATIKITEVGPLKISKNEWQKELAEDKIPPELFEIKIYKDPLIFDGKYFIVFTTSDKQTGLDYFEIKEGERNWKRAESPYLLEDRELRSIIKVKAVDKSGNERIAEHIPEIFKKPFSWQILLIFIIGLVIIGWMARKFLIPKS